MDFVRGDARIPQDMKKMKWQMDQTGDKMEFNAENRSDREIPFQLTEFNFICNWIWSATVSSLSFHIFLCQMIIKTVHFGSVAQEQEHSYQSKSNHCTPAELPNFDGLWPI